MKKEKKEQVTFTISSEIIEKFRKLANENALNMSKFVQNKIEEYITQNLKK